MAIVKSACAQWSGDIKTGKGSISTESGALSDAPYGFAIRFEGQKGTNPEELLGAAHAACFTMALSGALGKEGLVAEQLKTTARVTLDKEGEGWAIKSSHLVLEGRAPGADKSKLAEIAEGAKASCPLSKVIKADITLEQTWS